ncbi:MAG: putative DNA binding domain-containing protein [Candidatus Omnitrophica bacterium]|nr:putative DNA binding domain-containing protein [Candidatus Omnitrophota bacterium]
MGRFERLVRELTKLPTETEWLEFKRNNAAPEEIGENISAISNSCVLHEKATGYLLWGVDNRTHQIVGTPPVCFGKAHVQCVSPKASWDSGFQLPPGISDHPRHNQ